MRWRHGRCAESSPAMLAWIGAGEPVPHGRQGLNKPLRCRPLEGRRDQRSPLRRCFKPRPPLSAGCAGFASGCRLSGSELKRPTRPPSGLESLGFESRPHSGRLSGLLSGCPPIDTRPQARAKLGKLQISDFRKPCKSFARLARIPDQKKLENRFSLSQCGNTASLGRREFVRATPAR